MSDKMRVNIDRVVEFMYNEEFKTIIATELCDEYYSTALSLEQLQQFINALQEMHNNVKIYETERNKLPQLEWEIIEVDKEWKALNYTIKSFPNLLIPNKTYYLLNNKDRGIVDYRYEIIDYAMNAAQFDYEQQTLGASNE